MTKTGNRRRLTLVIAIVVVVVAAAGASWWFFLRDTTASANTPATTTTTVTVSAGNLTKSVTASGTLTPAVQESVNFAAGGKVTAVKVAQGQTVTKGQVLGTIDTVDLEATLASAKASLAAAQAKVADDETAVTAAADTESTADDAAAAAALAADQATVSTATAQVQAATQALQNATLTSPVEGVVAEVNVAVGDQVAGSSTGNSAGSSSAGKSGGSGTGGTGGSGSANTSSAQFLIVGTKTWLANLTIDDTQINLIKSGLQAQLTVSGATQTLFGRVTSVGLISTSTGSTASYPVVVALTGTQTGLHDGTSVSASIIYQQLSDVLLVPTLAIHTDNGTQTVELVKDGKAVSTTITTGQSSGEMTQVLTGLSEGDQVQITRTVLGGGNSTRSTTGRGGPGEGGFRGGEGGFPGGAGGFPGGAGNGGAQFRNNSGGR